MSEPLTSVRTRRRSDGVRCESVVIEGILEMNSGIKLITRYKVKDVELEVDARRSEGLCLPKLDKVCEQEIVNGQRRSV